MRRIPKRRRTLQTTINATSTIQKHNVLFTGDFNSNLSESNLNRYTYHCTTNTTGKLVNDYAEEANLKVTNTNFRKRLGKLWTYMSDMNGTNNI